MNKQEAIPGGMPVAEFLESYWQKKPCLLRQAFPGFKADFDQGALLALAHDEAVESRLVLEQDGDYPWQVLHGPFQTGELDYLPQSHWSLLVQNAELHLPSAHQLLQHFCFIPNWRIDDLMISYAADSGSVGPHLDSYDVFLLQAAGKREWAINTDDFDESNFIDDLDLRIIDNFRAEEKFTLEAGDMLYLPPGVAHHGIAIGESITCSIGFRAPSSQELLAHFVDEVLQESPDQRYSDPDLVPREHCGEISTEELAGIERLFRSSLPDASALATWFGRYVSQAPESLRDAEPSAQMNQAEMLLNLKSSRLLVKSASVRSVFIRKDDGLVLFANGIDYFLNLEFSGFVYDFCSKHKMENPLHGLDTPAEELAKVIQELYLRGLLSTE